MAVKTHWSIHHSCGHEQEHDLSAKRADERAGYAKWLGGRDCTDCWRATHDSGNGDTQQWLAERRAEEAATAEQWATDTGMPLLSGSEKAVDWAGRVRYELMRALYEWAVQEGHAPDDYDPAEATARGIDTASWWLDNRKHADQPTDPETLLELLTAAAGTGEGSDCENTY